MRNLAWLSAVFMMVLLLGAGGCRKYTTYPIYRRPVISSLVAFPTTLGPGDSTLVTVVATDPNGDPLSYHWESYNGLTPKDPTPYYSTRASMVFYRSWAPSSYDTAFVSCTASDRRGGSDGGRILIFYED